MKYLLFIFLTILFVSCSDSNPVSPVINKMPMSKQVYDNPPKKKKHIYIPPPALKIKYPDF